MPASEGINVDGLTVVSRNLRTLDRDLPKGLRGVHLKLAEPIAESAAGAAPSRSGRLAGSVRAKATQKSGSISAGARLRYGPVIHYGWPAHNIDPDPFLTETIQDAAGGLADDYETALFDWIESVWETTTT